MKEKNKVSLEEFETFQSEQEKSLWKIFLIGNAFFLGSSFLLMFISEGILKFGIVSWSRFWILVGGNLFMYFLFFLSFIKNFKIRFLKYIIAIYGPLLVGGWIYSTDPNYAKPILIFAVGMSSLLGFLFYDSKTFLISNITVFTIIGLLISYHFKIDTTITSYEVAIIFLTLPMLAIIGFVSLQRTRMFLIELLQKRKELQEAKSILEIKVKARTQELEELTKTLDQKVKKRTEELEEGKNILEKRVDELERFHKLTVGRELKMSELKKEIQKLKEEIENLKNKLGRPSS